MTADCLARVTVSAACAVFVGVLVPGVPMANTLGVDQCQRHAVPFGERAIDRTAGSASPVSRRIRTGAGGRGFVREFVGVGVLEVP